MGKMHSKWSDQKCFEPVFRLVSIQPVVLVFSLSALYQGWKQVATHTEELNESVCGGYDRHTYQPLDLSIALRLREDTTSKTNAHFFSPCTAQFWDVGLICFHNTPSFRLLERKYLKYTFKSLFYYTLSICICRFQFTEPVVSTSVYKPSVLFPSIFWRFFIIRLIYTSLYFSKYGKNVFLTPYCFPFLTDIFWFYVW